jgi:pre-rRNA-processing protein TSR3
MQPLFPTYIIRHKRENLKKCSLRGLESSPHFSFFQYPVKEIPDLSNYTLLTMDAPPLTANDSKNGLLILDATWRYAEQMLRQLEPYLKHTIRRSIPSSYRTSYPRRQHDCPEPDLGLASIEALYIAYRILGKNTEGILDHYYWKDHFLLNNEWT